jgi:hypothetical protein
MRPRAVRGQVGVRAQRVYLPRITNVPAKVRASTPMVKTRVLLRAPKGKTCGKTSGNDVPCLHADATRRLGRTRGP